MVFCINAFLLANRDSSVVEEHWRVICCNRGFGVDLGGVISKVWGAGGIWMTPLGRRPPKALEGSNVCNLSWGVRCGRAWVAPESPKGNIWFVVVGGWCGWGGSCSIDLFGSIWLDLWQAWIIRKNRSQAFSFESTYYKNKSISLCYSNVLVELFNELKLTGVWGLAGMVGLLEASISTKFPFNAKGESWIIPCRMFNSWLAIDWLLEETRFWLLLLFWLFKANMLFSGLHWVRLSGASSSTYKNQKVKLFSDILHTNGT